MTDLAETFAALHRGPELLILPNAWDAGSARIVVHAGAKAVATSSSACAWAKGYPDGEALPPEEVIAIIRAIVRAVPVPVSADIEMAYAQDATAAASFAQRVLDAGAVGVNIEDGLLAADLLCAKIEALRETASKKGVALWINARTDVYLKGLKEGEAALAETLARAERYAAAGANSIFVPGVVDPALIEKLVRGISLPLNVLVRAGLPPAAKLKALGVRRLSAGGGVGRAALGYAYTIARDFLQTGRSELFGEGPAVALNLNELMKS